MAKIASTTTPLFLESPKQKAAGIFYSPILSKAYSPFSKSHGFAYEILKWINP